MDEENTYDDVFEGIKMRRLKGPHFSKSKYGLPVAVEEPSQAPILLKLSDLNTIGITLSEYSNGCVFNPQTQCWEDKNFNVDLSGFDEDGNICDLKGSMDSFERGQELTVDLSSFKTNNIENFSNITELYGKGRNINLAERERKGGSLFRFDNASKISGRSTQEDISTSDHEFDCDFDDPENVFLTEHRTLDNFVKDTGNIEKSARESPKPITIYMERNDEDFLEDVNNMSPGYGKIEIDDLRSSHHGKSEGFLRMMNPSGDEERVGKVGGNKTGINIKRGTISLNNYQEVMVNMTNTSGFPPRLTLDKDSPMTVVSDSTNEQVTSNSTSPSPDPYQRPHSRNSAQDSAPGSQFSETGSQASFEMDEPSNGAFVGAVRRYIRPERSLPTSQCSRSSFSVDETGSTMSMTEEDVEEEGGLELMGADDNWDDVFEGDLDFSHVDAVRAMPVPLSLPHTLAHHATATVSSRDGTSSSPHREHKNSGSPRSVQNAIHGSQQQQHRKPSALATSRSFTQSETNPIGGAVAGGANGKRTVASSTADMSRARDKGPGKPPSRSTRPPSREKGVQRSRSGGTTVVPSSNRRGDGAAGGGVSGKKVSGPTLIRPEDFQNMSLQSSSSGVGTESQSVTVQDLDEIDWGDGDDDEDMDDLSVKSSHLVRQSSRHQDDTKENLIADRRDGVTQVQRVSAPFSVKASSTQSFTRASTAAEFTLTDVMVDLFRDSEVGHDELMALVAGETWRETLQLTKRGNDATRSPNAASGSSTTVVSGGSYGLRSPSRPGSASSGSRPVIAAEATMEAAAVSSHDTVELSMTFPLTRTNSHGPSDSASSIAAASRPARGAQVPSLVHSFSASSAGFQMMLSQATGPVVALHNVQLDDDYDSAATFASDSSHTSSSTNTANAATVATTGTTSSTKQSQAQSKGTSGGRSVESKLQRGTHPAPVSTANTGRQYGQELLLNARLGKRIHTLSRVWDHFAQAQQS